VAAGQSAGTPESDLLKMVTTPCELDETGSCASELKFGLAIKLSLTEYPICANAVCRAVASALSAFALAIASLFIAEVLAAILASSVATHALPDHLEVLLLSLVLYQISPVTSVPGGLFAGAVPCLYVLFLALAIA